MPFKPIRELFQNPFKWICMLFTALPLVWLVDYILNNRRNIPIWDESRLLPIVYQTANGTLNWQTLLKPELGHVTFFTNLTTWFSVRFLNWNLALIAWFSLVMALAIFILVLILIVHTDKKSVELAMIPTAFLVFSLRQNLNWIVSYNHVWFLTILFMFAMMTTFVTIQKWWGIALAALFAFCSMLSTGAGLATWVVGLLYLALSPQRHWSKIAAWLGVMGVAVMVYLQLGGLESAGNSVLLDITLLLQTIRYTAIVVGLVFDGWITNASPLWVTGISLMVAVANGWFIWRRLDNYAYVNIWLPIAAFSFGMAALSGLSRIPEYGYEIAYWSTWYTTPANCYWLTITVGMAMVLKHTLTQPTRSATTQVYLVGNLLFAFFLAAAYLPATQYSLGHYFSLTFRAKNDVCASKFIFYQDQRQIVECNLDEWEMETYNQLAARRLTVYATIPRDEILHDDAADTSPVLIESGSAWLNKHIVDYLLTETDPTRLIHVFPEDTLSISIPNPPTRSEPDSLLTQPGEHESFWYVRRGEFESQMPELWDELFRRGYIITDTRQHDNNILVSRVIQVTADNTDPVQFGDHIQLLAISSVDNIVEPCGTLNLQTVWSTGERLETDYSITLKLLDGEFNNMLQSDGQLTAVRSRDWVADQVYLDSRALNIPCDLPAGDYQLALGIYFYQDPALLTTTGETPPGLDGLHILSSITVQ